MIVMGDRVISPAERKSEKTSNSGRNDAVALNFKF